MFGEQRCKLKSNSKVWCKITPAPVGVNTKGHFSVAVFYFIQMFYRQKLCLSYVLLAA